MPYKKVIRYYVILFCAFYLKGFFLKECSCLILLNLQIYAGIVETDFISQGTMRVYEFIILQFPFSNVEPTDTLLWNLEIIVCEWWPPKTSVC
jgi:hypothetical protein